MSDNESDNNIPSTPRILDESESQYQVSTCGTTRIETDPGKYTKRKG